MGCIRKCEEISAEMTPVRKLSKFPRDFLSRPSFEPVYRRGYTKFSQQVLNWSIEAEDGVTISATPRAILLHTTSCRKGPRNGSAASAHGTP